ncbi:MAG: hypothetical protein IKC61_03355 [Clostridia bacterium]|nr:hypothetical protein [Clostridia bacterium]
MDSLKTVVELASTGPIGFITVVLFLLAAVATFYFIYRGIRDFEVFLLERRRLEDEIIVKEEKTE